MKLYQFIDDWCKYFGSQEALEVMYYQHQLVSYLNLFILESNCKSYIKMRIWRIANIKFAIGLYIYS